MIVYRARAEQSTVSKFESDIALFTRNNFFKTALCIAQRVTEVSLAFCFLVERYWYYKSARRMTH